MELIKEIVNEGVVYLKPMGNGNDGTEIVTMMSKYHIEGSTNTVISDICEVNGKNYNSVIKSAKFILGDKHIVPVIINQELIFISMKVLGGKNNSKIYINYFNIDEMDFNHIINKNMPVIFSQFDNGNYAWHKEIITGDTTERKGKEMISEVIHATGEVMGRFSVIDEIKARKKEILKFYLEYVKLNKYNANSTL